MSTSSSCLHRLLGEVTSHSLVCILLLKCKRRGKPGGRLIVLEHVNDFAALVSFPGENKME